jgi:mannose-6-phosphate isomerase-like protein (cupin superfamily)
MPISADADLHLQFAHGQVCRRDVQGEADTLRALTISFFEEEAMTDFMKSADCSIQNPGRRNFLRAAPVAAAAGFALADASLLALPAGDPPQKSAVKFQLFSAPEIAKDMRKLEANPGNANLVEEKGDIGFSMVMTAEKDKIAPEFESHQHRDHIFQILEGSTVYEVGGTPKGGRVIAPGEWRGPEVVGATKLTLNKGDQLVIPRGTPHKRSTAGSVTLMLISPGEPATT